MTADTFREILRRAPFEPFRVVMSSGESYNVMHPEMALVSARALVLAVPDNTHPEGEPLGVLLVPAHRSHRDAPPGGTACKLTK